MLAAGGLLDSAGVLRAATLLRHLVQVDLGNFGSYVQAVVVADTLEASNEYILAISCHYLANHRWPLILKHVDLGNLCERCSLHRL